MDLVCQKLNNNLNSEIRMDLDPDNNELDEKSEEDKKSN